MQELYQKNAFSDKTKRGKEAKLLLHFFTPSGYSGRSGRIRRTVRWIWSGQILSGFNRRSGFVTGSTVGLVRTGVAGVVVFITTSPPA